MAKEDIQRLYSGDLHSQPKDIDDILATGPEREGGYQEQLLGSWFGYLVSEK